MMQPHERFKAWAGSEEGREWFREKIEFYKKLSAQRLNVLAPRGVRRWVEVQYLQMVEWLEHNPRKGNKRCWDRFARNWLSKAFNQLFIDHYLLKPAHRFTAEEENRYYAEKSRASDDG